MIPLAEQQNLAAGYVLGDLGLEESRLLAQLLTDNPSLQTEIVELQQSLDQVYGEEIALPPNLKSRVLAASSQAMDLVSESVLETIPDVDPHADPTSSPLINARTRFRSPFTGSSAQRAWNTLGMVAAAVAIALSIQNYSLKQQLQQIQASLSEPPADTVALSLEPTNASQSGSVEVIVSPSQLTAQIKAAKLPPLKAGQVYALWTVVSENAPVTADSKNAILTAAFTVDESGNLAQKISLPSVFQNQAAVIAVAITIEDATAPQLHQSSPILIQRL